MKNKTSIVLSVIALLVSAFVFPQARWHLFADGIRHGADLVLALQIFAASLVVLFFLVRYQNFWSVVFAAVGALLFFTLVDGGDAWLNVKGCNLYTTYAQCKVEQDAAAYLAQLDADVDARKGILYPHRDDTKEVMPTGVVETSSEGITFATGTGKDAGGPNVLFIIPSNCPPDAIAQKTVTVRYKHHLKMGISGTELKTPIMVCPSEGS